MADLQTSVAVTDAALVTTDVTTNDASTTKHGFLKKLDNTATNFMNGAGNWAAPAATGQKPLFVGFQSYASTGNGWPAANDAILFPFELQAAGTISGIWIYIVLQAGNVDAGIYNSAGTRQVSKGTTASPATGLQQLTFTGTELAAGRYYLALASNTATNFAVRVANAADPITVVGRKIASSFPLPASLTIGSTTTLELPAMIAEVT